MADEQGPGIDTNPGPRNADRNKKSFENFHLLKRFTVFPLSPLAVRVFFGFGFP